MRDQGLVLGVHVDHDALARGPVQHPEDLPVVEAEVGDGGEDLETREALGRERADFVEHARGVGVGDHDVDAVVEVASALALGHLGLHRCPQGLAAGLEGEVHEAGDAAGGGGAAPALEVVGGRGVADPAVEVSVDVDRARGDDQP